MGPKVGRKRQHHGIRDVKRSVKTKARTRDLDQIFEDMEEKNFEKLVSRAIDPELPGFGQHYCVPVSLLINYSALVISSILKLKWNICEQSCTKRE